MSHYKTRLTQSGEKMGLALQAACMDPGKAYENGCRSFAYRDVGSTTPWMGEVESSLEQRPRATQGAVAEGCGSFAFVKVPLRVFHCTSGITTLQALRPDWNFFKGNSINTTGENRH